VRGVKDEIVPSGHSTRLLEAAKKAQFKSIFEVPDGDHNYTWKIAGDSYVDEFKKFFVKCEKN